MSQTLQQPRLGAVGNAFVMITCQTGSERYIMDELETIRGVKKIESTVGPYDIVAKIEIGTVGLLRDTICKIRKIPEIRTTTTIVCESSSFC